MSKVMGSRKNEDVVTMDSWRGLYAKITCAKLNSLSGMSRDCSGMSRDCSGMSCDC